MTFRVSLTCFPSPNPFSLFIVPRAQTRNEASSWLKKPTKSFTMPKKTSITLVSSNNKRLEDKRSSKTSSVQTLISLAKYFDWLAFEKATESTAAFSELFPSLMNRERAHFHSSISFFGDEVPFGCVIAVIPNQYLKLRNQITEASNLIELHFHEALFINSIFSLPLLPLPSTEVHRDKHIISASFLT